jgi:polar amino acid transport system substrate-binding protein
MVELTGAYHRLATESFDYFGTGLLVALIYLLLGLPFVRLARYSESRLAKGRRISVNNPPFSPGAGAGRAEGAKS